MYGVTKPSACTGTADTASRTALQAATFSNFKMDPPLERSSVIVDERSQNCARPAASRNLEGGVQAGSEDQGGRLDSAEVVDGMIASLGLQRHRSMEKILNAAADVETELRFRIADRLPVVFKLHEIRTEARPDDRMQLAAFPVVIEIHSNRYLPH